MPTLYYRTWAKKISSNFYQNPSTFADAMQKVLAFLCLALYFNELEDRLQEKSP